MVPSSLQALDRSGPNGTANYASWKLLAGDFIAGMLATLHNPHSAPFVGSAVTVALAVIRRIIWYFNGNGYRACRTVDDGGPVSDFVRFLPKPGPWMGWLKRGLAGLLMATMVWIGWLLTAVQGGVAAI